MCVLADEVELEVELSDELEAEECELGGCGLIVDFVSVWTRRSRSDS